MKKLYTMISLLVFSGFLAKAQESHIITYDGEQREYLVHVPENYNNEQNLPLVLNLHGFSSTAASQESYTQFDEVADTARFIVLYPQGLVRTIDTGETGEHWNAYFGTEVDDKGFILHLIDLMIDQYKIDPGRVYATGWSNGGYMSYLLACEASDRFAAIASVSGNMVFAQLPNCSPANPVAILHIHGTDDKTVSYSGSSRSAGVPEVIQKWLALDDCETSDVVEQQLPDITTTDSSTVLKYVYQQCSFNSEVELYKVEGGGHTWPGSPMLRPDLGPTNQDINASAVIWNFFKRHSNSTLVAGSENDLDDKIDVFPTIFQDQIQIRHISGQNQILMYTASGTLIKTASATEKDYLMPVSDISSGFYLLRIVRNGLPDQTFRVVKN